MPTPGLDFLRMCTVVIEVPQRAADPVRMLAVRDEDPARPWDGPGEWWADRPGVVGVRDRRANGAWLAVSSAAGRLAVILNRGEPVEAPDGSPLASRGAIVLDSVAGIPLRGRPRTAAFNLVEIEGGRATATSWDGVSVRRAALGPGVHMIAHHDVDDPRSARIVRWLPEFRALAEEEGRRSPFDEWSGRWIGLLGRSAELGPDDDRAIVRDNTPHGYPTRSLLVCVAEVGVAEVGVAEVSATGTSATEPGDGETGAGETGHVDLAWAPLADPGRWDSPPLRRA